MIFVSTSPLEPRSRSLIRVYSSALILSLVKWNNKFDFQLKFKNYFDIVLWKKFKFEKPVFLFNPKL